MNDVELVGLKERLKWATEGNIVTGCWEWTKAKDQQGYGKIYFKGKDWRAHRLAWTAYRGEIPDGLDVLHHCNCTTCINPAHLFLGDQQDNIDDLLTKHPDAFKDYRPPVRVSKLLQSLPQETLDRVSDMRRSGKTLRQIGLETGLNAYAVKYLCKQRGIPTPRRWPPERIAEAIRMLESGMRLREVAELLGCPTGSVQVITKWRKYKKTS